MKRKAKYKLFAAITGLGQVAAGYLCIMFGYEVGTVGAGSVAAVVLFFTSLTAIPLFDTPDDDDTAP